MDERFFDVKKANLINPARATETIWAAYLAPKEAAEMESPDHASALLFALSRPPSIFAEQTDPCTPTERH
jgi:hypothetical protein